MDHVRSCNPSFEIKSLLIPLRAISLLGDLPRRRNTDSEIFVAIILEIYGYDAEEHANIAIARFLQQREPADPQTGVTKALEDRYMNWFRPT